MVCLICPKSCLLSVTDKDIIAVENNGCNKGMEYAKKELVDPERMLTSTMRVSFGELPLVSVRSDKPVKKGELKNLIKQLDNIIVPAPVLSGQILVSLLGENKVNIVATRTIEKVQHKKYNRL
jgi:CxxC motif-containing protein